MRSYHVVVLALFFSPQIWFFVFPTVCLKGVEWFRSLPLTFSSDITSEALIVPMPLNVVIMVQAGR